MKTLTPSQYGALRYGPQRLRRARRLRAAGLTFEAIGARLGVSRQRVHQLLKRQPEHG